MGRSLKMHKDFIELLLGARKVCEACEVKVGEKVTILSDTGSNQNLVEAFYTAASLVTEPVMVVTRARKLLVPPPEHVVHFLCEANIVFDLASQPWLYTKAIDQVLDSGARMLQVLCTEDSLKSRPPDPKIIELTYKAAQLLSRCKEIRITSDLGTAIRMSRGNRPVWAQPGIVRAPGEWDSLGLSMVNFAPLEKEADGVLYLNGPIYFHPNKFVIETPIRVEVNKGRITNIDTELAQGRALASWLASFNDPGSYVPAHVGFGTDPRAGLEPPDPAAWEGIQGGVIVAFGANTARAYAGENSCKSHFDAVLLNANFHADDVELVDKGKLTAIFEEAADAKPARSVA
jgi:hypothetical protein